MEAYGIALPKPLQGLDQALIELWFFRHAPRLIQLARDGKSKYNGTRFTHLKAAVDLLIPKHEWEWNPWSELMLSAMCESKETILTGAGSSGKSTAMALYALFFWLCATKCTGVIVTSTTEAGLKARVWSEIVRFFTILKPMIPGGEHNLSKIRIIDDKNSSKHGIFGRAVSTGSPERSLGTLIGIHPKRMLVIVDEMTDTPYSIIEASWTNFDGSEEEFAFLGSGNAKSKADPHGRRCEPKGGWASVTVDTVTYQTKFNGRVVHLDGEKSPNLEFPDQDRRFKHLWGKTMLEEKRMQLGVNSPAYYRFVRGWWSEGVDNLHVIPLDVIERSLAMKSIRLDTVIATYASLDVGAGGEDRMVLRFAELGTYKNKNHIRFTDIIEIQVDKTSLIGLGQQVANQVIPECNSRGVSPERLVIDCSGMCQYAANIIEITWGCGPVKKIQFSGKTSDRMLHTMSDERCSDKYERMSSQMWSQSRMFIEFDQVSGIDAVTVDELSNRLWNKNSGATRSGRLEIEPKSQQRLRMNKSPDYADCAVMICEGIASDGYLPDPTGVAWGDWLTQTKEYHNAGRSLFPEVKQNVFTEAESLGYTHEYDPEMTYL